VVGDALAFHQFWRPGIHALRDRRLRLPGQAVANRALVAINPRPRGQIRLVELKRNLLRHLARDDGVERPMRQLLLKRHVRGRCGYRGFSREEIKIDPRHNGNRSQNHSRDQRTERSHPEILLKCRLNDKENNISDAQIKWTAQIKNGGSEWGSNPPVTGLPAARRF